MKSAPTFFTKRIASLVLLALSSVASQAATPSGGDLLRQQGSGAPVVGGAGVASDGRVQVLPAEQAQAQGLTLPAGVKVLVSAVSIEGAATIPVSELQAVVAGEVGRELEFAQLQGLADKLTTHYRQRGYLLARAILPAQKIEGGRVRLVVQEGRLGRLQLSASEGLDAQALRAWFDGVVEGQPLRREPLEAALLRLSDLPGVRVQSVLRPSAVAGATDLDIRVEGGRSVGGGLSLDNYGNRYTGRARLGARMSVANLLGLGDSLDANLATSGAGMAYGRLAWQRPIGASGLQAGAAYSALRYKLGRDFSHLGASGRASDFTLFGLASLERGRLASSQLQLALDAKRYADSTSAGGLSTKRITSLALNHSASRAEDGGSRQTGLGLTVGRLQVDASSVANASRNSYAKLTGQIEQQRNLAPNLDLTLRLSGQLASRNLDASEKFALGGPQAVRAYASGGAGSDDGLLLSAEVSKVVLEGWRAKLFADLGAGRIAHQPLPTDTHNTHRLMALGVGADTVLPGQVQLQLGAALPLADQHQDERGPALWLQLNKNF